MRGRHSAATPVAIPVTVKYTLATRHLSGMKDILQGTTQAKKIMMRLIDRKELLFRTLHSETRSGSRIALLHQTGPCAAVGVPFRVTWLDAGLRGCGCRWMMKGADEVQRLALWSVGGDEAEVEDDEREEKEGGRRVGGIVLKAFGHAH